MNFQYEHAADCATLIVPSDPKSLALVRSVVQFAAGVAGLDETASYEVVLAVNEACSNVITHAYGGDHRRSMALEYRLLEEALEFRLRDDGAHFDFDRVAQLDPGALRKGGRGVFLIRQYMDEVSCSALPSGGNELRMLRRTGSAAR